jgi:hypothetical protein
MAAGVPPRWIRAAAAAFVCIWTLAAAPSPPSAPSPLSDWAAVFVAGDWRAHSGAPSEAFDNARRDVGREFVAAGLSPRNIRQFSARPDAHADHPLESRPAVVGESLTRLAAEARGGCLVYLTSHGQPDAVVFGPKLFPSAGMARLVDDACGARPTVVILSACFSGSFLPALQAPDRMILTAARADRSSFGCGESDRYPYFDACVVGALPRAHDFIGLADRVKRCVADKEKATGSSPPSEPQLWIGPELRPRLPFLTFARAGGAGAQAGGQP